MKTVMDGVFVEVQDGEMSEQEIREYLFYLRNKKNGRTLKSLTLKPDGDYVNMWYEWKPEDFVRLRRITGYLTVDVKRWNNAKRAEEHDRVKHI